MNSLQLELDNINDSIEEIASRMWELIDGLLALDELSENSDRTPNPNDGNGGGTARGSIERKTINGCGPYLYLRYWSGGKHRSVYLGKAKD